MHTVNLGTEGPSVGRVGLGCMGMSWGYDQEGWDDATSVRVIHQAIDMGVRFFDTADQYGPFTNERLVGKALRDRRDEVVLATKGGLIVDGARRTHRNGRPEHLRAACEASLLRLGTDHVDLYQLHRVDPAVPLEESWGAMAELVEAGLTKAIGLSEASVDEISRAHAIHPVASVQSELSLWSPDATGDVVPYCAEQGITFIAFAPLGRGFLSGRITTVEDLPRVDARRGIPRFQPDAIAANQAITETTGRIAARLGITVPQLAIAWVLAQGPGVMALPGTKTPKYLEENVAAGAVTLPAEVLAELADLPAAVGSR